MKGTAFNIARKRGRPEDAEDVEQDLLVELLTVFTESPQLFGRLNNFRCDCCSAAFASDTSGRPYL